MKSLSRVRLCATPWTAAYQAPLSMGFSRQEYWSGVPFPASGSFQIVLHIGWPKYWSFSFSPSNEYTGVISFRMDWLDLLAVQGTLKSLLQHHSSKASMLRRSAFFIVQLSYPYTEKGMAPHSSTLAWKIPWMEELGRLQSTGSRRVGHD